MGNNVGLLGKGIDYRTDGGYVIAAGSVHRSGAMYQLVNPNAKVAAMPDWLLQRLSTPPEPSKSKAPKCKARKADEIPEGTRNDTLFREGCRMRGKGAAEPEIGKALAAINEGRCEPPLGADEVSGIATSAASYPASDVISGAAARNQFWWFPIDVNRVCTDIRFVVLTDRQFGWLMRLKIYAWPKRGYLPNDPKILAKLANASDHENFVNEMAAIMPFFGVTEDEAQIFDAELTTYWAEKTEQSKANSKAGKLSAAKRGESKAKKSGEGSKEK